ncbi:MAG: chemotaxis protein CheW [Trueperaceae bacterium]
MNAAPTTSQRPLGAEHLLVFRLDDDRYALNASAVLRVTWAVRITRLPVAPEVVLGVIDVAGRVLPVVDTRQRFGLPRRDLLVSDNLIIARTSRRQLVLAVDQVDGVIEYPEEKVQAAPEIVPGTDYVRGVAKLADGLVLIHDLDTFLSLDEEQSLDRALELSLDRQEPEGGGDPGGAGGGDDAQ